MEIIKTGQQELTITGNIKSIDDSAAIKAQIISLVKGGATDLVLKIEDSFSMTSSIIGYLMKVVHRDHVRLSMAVRDRRLYELLSELNLITLFNVHKM